MEMIEAFWNENQATLVVVGVAITGIALTAVVVWLIRRIVKPIIGIAVGVVLTAVSTFLTGKSAGLMEMVNAATSVSG